MIINTIFNVNNILLLNTGHYYLIVIAQIFSILLCQSSRLKSNQMPKYVETSLPEVNSTLSSHLEPSDPKINQLIEHQCRKNKNRRKIKQSYNSRKWSKVETEYFYHLLDIYGTDFSIMAINYNDLKNLEQLSIRGRSKRQLVNKYRKQQKKNSQRLNIAFTKAWKNQKFGSKYQEQHEFTSLRQSKRLSIIQISSNDSKKLQNEIQSKNP